MSTADSHNLGDAQNLACHDRCCSCLLRLTQQYGRGGTASLIGIATFGVKLNTTLYQLSNTKDVTSPSDQSRQAPTRNHSSSVRFVDLKYGQSVKLQEMGGPPGSLRTPLTGVRNSIFLIPRGTCSNLSTCYGAFLSRNDVVYQGTTVGIGYEGVIEARPAIRKALAHDEQFGHT